MAKILNLDALPPTPDDLKRVIRVKGADHPIVDMKVDDFIAITREAQALATNEDATIADHMEVTIKMITRCVPTLTKEDLGGYDLPKLAKIAAFVRGEDAEPKVPAETVQEGDAAKK